MEKWYDRLETVRKRNAIKHWCVQKPFEMDCLLKDERQKFLGTNVSARWLITDSRGLELDSAALILLIIKFADYAGMYQQDYYDKDFTADQVEAFYSALFLLYFKCIYAGIFEDESLDGLLDISVACEYDTGFFLRSVEEKQKESKLQFTALMRDATDFRIQFPRSPRDMAKVVQATVCAFVRALPEPTYDVYERRADVEALTGELILISQQINAVRRYLEKNAIIYDEKNELQCEAMQQSTKALEIFMEAIDHVISARAAIMEDNSY